uniref:Uncharacterized protein n=1 Tax=Anguilla anguilla TaxID=7936 RepID=A0A0E9VC55_ANGAN
MSVIAHTDWLHRHCKPVTKQALTVLDVDTTDNPL